MLFLVLFLKGTDMEKKIDIGLFVKVMDDPSYSLMAKHAGYDLIFYDLEHGYIPLEKCANLMLLNHGYGLTSFIRVPQLDKAWVSKALDCGADGIMVPMIETTKQALDLVNYSKYLPLGKRGYSGGANTYYGPSGNHQVNMEKANKRIVTIAQIETKLGVENIEAIANVEGIDALIVGPADLGISLGLSDDLNHPLLIESIIKVANVAQKYNKKFGIIGNLTLHGLVKDHLDYIISSIDINCIKQMFKQQMESIQSFINQGE